MIRYRYSLSGLLLAIFIVAVVLGAMLYPSPFSEKCIFTFTLGLLLYSIIGAMYRVGDRRRFRGRFAVFGWGYLMISFGPWFGGNWSPVLLTEDAVQLQHRAMKRLMQGPIDQAVEHRLRTPVTLDFAKTPLSDVVDFLGDLTNVIVVLDKPALAEAEIRIDVPVTLRVEQLDLASALRIMLRPVGLSFAAREGTIVITTPNYVGQSPGFPYLPLIGHSLWAIALALVGGRLAVGRKSDPAKG